MEVITKMDEKEVNMQKALGTFDHMECVKCGLVSHKNELVVPIYETIRGIAPFQVCTGTTYRCKCGSEQFKDVSEEN